MAVPNIFATATSSIPLSQLDTNFATAITLGSTALYLGNTTTSVAGLTLTGSAFNGTVGATTASTGAFTTVTATGGVDKLTSATGVVSVSAATAPSSGQVLTATSSTVATWQTPATTNLASPGPIGNTTPSTGAFTTLSASSTVSAAGSTTIDSSGNLGVGATAPSTWGALAVRKAVTVSGRSVSGSFSDGSTGTMEIAHASGYVALDTESGSTALRIAQAGTINGQFNQYGLGIGSGVPSSGMGITFPATQSASTDANTLDDYEEGTWTPTVGGTATYSIQTGTYVKIGQSVSIWADVSIGSIGSGSTTQLQGLPFTTRSAAPAPVMGAALGYFAGVATSVVTIFPRIDPGSTTMVLASLASAATSVASNALWADGTRIVITFTYRTTA